MSAPALVPFPFTVFVKPDGTPVSNGRAELVLSKDVNNGSNGCVCASKVVTVQLDDTGAMNPVPNVWPNDGVQPNDTVYILSVYTSDGQLVFVEQFYVDGSGLLGSVGKGI